LRETGVDLRPQVQAAANDGNRSDTEKNQNSAQDPAEHGELSLNLTAIAGSHPWNLLAYSGQHDARSTYGDDGS
jgi:hypothetical protein